MSYLDISLSDYTNLVLLDFLFCPSVQFCTERNRTERRDLDLFQWSKTQRVTCATPTLPPLLQSLQL